jgi:hypothetical protein
MRLRLGLVTFATLLFVLGAVGLVGEWALATAVVVFVGTAVITAIVWEERDAAAGDLVPARVERS